MATNIIMPQLGESVVEGTVSEWLKKVGDTVSEYEPIVRVSTDKVDTEIPSPVAGVLLAIYVQEGSTVNAGVVLGEIGAQGEQVATLSAPTAAPANAPAPMASAPAAPSASSPAPAVDKGYTGHVTPVVARMIAEHGLDVNAIKGTGRDGRITKKDVLAYLESNGATTTASSLAPWEQPGSGDLFKPAVEYELPSAPSTPSAPVAPAASVAPSTPPAPVAPAAPVAPPTPSAPVAPVAPPTPPAPVSSSIPSELLAITSMRRSIADHMVQSKRIAPHATTIFEVDLGQVVAHRDANKAAFAKQGVKLTFTPYFVWACARALLNHPMLNARWTDEGIVVQHAANIGMATALPDGLIVPVLKNAQDYNLIGLARKVNDLAERARTRQLLPDEVRDGTFTITNHGVSGSLFATPIINQPQSAILGVGAIEKRVKVVNDAIAIRPCAYLSLSFDHRLIDGASADAFVAEVKQLLESWQ